MRDKIELYGCFQKAKLSLFSIKSITGNKQNGSKLSHEDLPAIISCQKVLEFYFLVMKRRAANNTKHNLTGFTKVGIVYRVGKAKGTSTLRSALNRVVVMAVTPCSK